MKARIVHVGDSEGIWIPKPLLEQSGLGEQVEFEVQHHRIIIRAAARPREGWAAAFQSMSAHGDDALLDAGAAGSTEWEAAEWEW